MSIENLDSVIKFWRIAREYPKGLTGVLVKPTIVFMLIDEIDRLRPLQTLPHAVQWAAETLSGEEAARKVLKDTAKGLEPMPPAASKGYDEPMSAEMGWKTKFEDYDDYGRKVLAVWTHDGEPKAYLYREGPYPPESVCTATHLLSVRRQPAPAERPPADTADEDLAAKQQWTDKELCAIQGAGKPKPAVEIKVDKTISIEAVRCIKCGWADEAVVSDHYGAACPVCKTTTTVNRLLPLVCGDGSYHYPDGASIHKSNEIADRFIAFWAKDSNGRKSLHRNELNELSYYKTVVEAAMAFKDSGEGPDSDAWDYWGNGAKQKSVDDVVAAGAYELQPTTIDFGSHAFSRYDIEYCRTTPEGTEVCPVGQEHFVTLYGRCHAEVQAIGNFKTFADASAVYQRIVGRHYSSDAAQREADVKGLRSLRDLNASIADVEQWLRTIGTALQHRPSFMIKAIDRMYQVAMTPGHYIEVVGIENYDYRGLADFIHVQLLQRKTHPCPA